jgi:regulator of nonsense transcripts 1
MKSNANIPVEQTSGYSVDFVWKSTSYDRMQNALKTFALDENSLSGFLYHKLLGHEVEEQRVRAKLPAKPKAPGEHAHLALPFRVYAQRPRRADMVARLLIF